MRLAAERDSDGTLYRYIYAPDGTPLALTKGSGEAAVTYAYHTDAQGSVVALTNPAGTVVARYRYDAFGRVTYAGGADAALAARNPLRYRDYYHDAATGFYYLPARYYDPATARFLSPDPAPPSAGDPLSLNAYAYCVGDPVNSYDPTGAVMDVMGDGKIGPEDIATHNYVHAPAGSPQKDALRQKMITSVKQAEAAAAAARKAEASARAQRAKQEGGLNLSLRPTHPDGVDMVLGAAGLAGDVLTACGGMLSVPAAGAGATAGELTAGPPGAVVGAAVAVARLNEGILVLNLGIDSAGMGYTTGKFLNRDASLGDMVMAAGGYIVGGSTINYATHGVLLGAEEHGWFDLYCD
jgi:RHS repeat-associated protein